jgi:4-hydroxy 2-oxovalerate aldolase
VIHASSRNVSYFKELNCEQYFCLVGNEGNRLKQNYGDLGGFNGVCILPPYPRKMGSVIPEAISKQCYELKHVNFTNRICDAHTSLALQAAKELGFEKAFIIGYDGYSNHSLNLKEQELYVENEALFEDAVNSGLELISLTRTRYEKLEQGSIYSMVK